MNSTSNCDNIVENRQEFNQTNSQIDKNAERNKTIENLLKHLDKEDHTYNNRKVNILKLSECLANDGKEFYVGVTSSNSYNSDYKEFINIFTTNDKEEAKLIQWMVFHMLIFHKNRKVCEHLGNRSIQELTDENNYKIYFAHNGRNQAKSTRFKNGNLSPICLEKIVLNNIIRLSDYLKDNRMIKFGFTTSLKKRLKEHKTNDEFRNNYEFILKDANLKLLSTGRLKFNQVEFTLNIYDIRKAMIMFISQFMFLEYKHYSHLLIDCSVDDIVGQIERGQTADVYFLLCKRAITIDDFRIKDKVIN